MKKESIAKNFWVKQPKISIDSVKKTAKRRSIVEIIKNAKADDFYWPFVIIAFLCAYLLANSLATEQLHDASMKVQSELFDKF